MSYSSGNDSVQGLKNESWISGMLELIPCYTWWSNTNKCGDFAYVKFRLHSPTKLHYCWRCFKCFLFCSLDEIWVWKGLFCAFLCVRFLFLCLIAWRMVVGFCRYNVSTSQCKYSRVTYSYGSISVWSTMSSCASCVFVPVLYFAFWQTIHSFWYSLDSLVDLSKRAPFSATVCSWLCTYFPFSASWSCFKVNMVLEYL